MNRILFLGAALLWGTAAFAQIPTVSVPNTFSSGTPISASQMNANFAALVQAVKDEVVPIGTVISSLVPPDASNDYMSGTSNQVWALADGVKPSTATSYTGSFPDLRGKFIRGMNVANSANTNAGNGADPDSRAVGSAQTDAFQGHRHQLSTNVVTRSWGDDQIDWHSLNASANDASYRNDLGPIGQYVLDPYADATNGTPRVATETRPANVAVYWYIKVK